MEKFLITGGAGFIGSNIARELVKNNKSVIILDNFSTGKQENLDDIRSEVKIIEGDICDVKLVNQLAGEATYILHQAALPSVPRSIADPVASNNVNVTGTLNLLNAAKDNDIKRFVYASSSSVYGDAATLPKEESMIPNPLSPYAVTKLTGEYYCRVFHKIYGLETVSLRYFNVFGPFQDPDSHYSAVIPKFITAISNGKTPTIYGDGEQSRDFTYISNNVAANIDACHNDGVAGEFFNVSCGSRTTLNEMIDLINKYLKTNIKPKYDKPRAGDVKHSQGSIEKAASILNFKSNKEFYDGLVETICWYQK